MFGLLMLAASVRYAISPERRFVPLQISLGILTLMAGTPRLRHQHDQDLHRHRRGPPVREASPGARGRMIKTFTVISEVPPDQRWIWMLAASEALNCVGLALLLAVLAVLAASAGAFRLTRGASSGTE